MPPLEAMQLGCPVLASNASSLPELVGDAGLLLDRDNSDDWAAAIRQLVADASLRINYLRQIKDGPANSFGRTLPGPLQGVMKRFCTRHTRGARLRPVAMAHRKAAGVR